MNVAIRPAALRASHSRAYPSGCIKFHSALGCRSREIGVLQCNRCDEIDWTAEHGLKRFLESEVGIKTVRNIAASCIKPFGHCRPENDESLDTVSSASR